MSREIRISSCVGKTTFNSWRKAQQASRRINRREHGEHVGPYRCRYCGQYHVGNSRRETERTVVSRRKYMESQRLAGELG